MKREAKLQRAASEPEGDRATARRDVVLLAKEDFQSLEETAYLLSCAENARRLLQALQVWAEIERPSPRSTSSRMRLEFDSQALEDLRYRVERDRRKAVRTLRLLQVCLRSPVAGAGKPEPLWHLLAGCWSRRIDRGHRLVYRVEGDGLIVLACRFHR